MVVWGKVVFINRKLTKLKGDKMEISEQVRRRAIRMLTDAGYVVDFSDAAAVLKALAEYEEKYKDMLEYILMQELEYSG